MKLPKYADILEQGKALVEKITAPIKNMQAKKQVEMTILQVEEQIATLQVQVHALYDVVPFNVRNVYELKNKIDLLEREKAFYAQVLDESF